ncbi:MAG: hypothetical protein R3F02_21450 [Thiolinea sp.]
MKLHYHSDSSFLYKSLVSAALVGLSFAAGGATFAICTSRGFALPPEWFYWLSTDTHFAKYLVAFFAVMLLLIWLWQRLRNPHQPHLENYIHDFILTFVGNNQANIKERWRVLLQRIFSASSAEISGGNLASPELSEEGMVLLIPGLGGNYHIDLYGKQDASRLFNKADIRLSQTLNELAAYTISLQQAKQQSQSNERNRIMRDLHDDVGANLVSMIYRAKNKQDAQLAKDTLTLLRETIYTLDDDSSMRLSLAIAKWRQDIQQRCQSADIRLEWQSGDIPGHYELDARQLVNLGRILREILTNALKHAHPNRFNVQFQIQRDWLHILVRHDGMIKPLDAWTEGKGLPSIRNRIRELHGKIHWELADSLEARIAIPIHREHADESTE